MNRLPRNENRFRVPRFGVPHRRDPSWEDPERQDPQVVLHYCTKCDHRWDRKTRQPLCPKCGAEDKLEFRTRSSPPYVIERKAVRVNDKGQILCHLVPGDEK